MFFVFLVVDVVFFVVDLVKLDMVDLRDIKIVRKFGGIVDDIEIFKGLVFDKKVLYLVGGFIRMEKVKIGLI